MKITRIQRIKTHRVFRDFIWPNNGLPDFGRFNLIYGWNGAGKTTLSGLFRHLQEKESITDGDVQFLIDGNIVHGSALATAMLPQVRVFNRDTVNRIIFESPHEELPPIYVIGEDSSEKQRQVEQLKQKAAATAKEQLAWDRKKSSAETTFETFCTDRAREIKNLLTTPGGGPYNNYNARGFKQMAQRLTAITPHVQRLSTEQRERYLAVKGGTPKEKVATLSVQYPDCAGLTHQVQQMLARSVLSNTLVELVADPTVAAWVGQGLPLHTGDKATAKCRFCDQPLPAERLKQLQEHFNDEFRSFQRDVDALILTVESAKERIATIQPPSKALLYPHLLQDYEKHVSILSQQSYIVRVYLRALHTALKAKKEEPFSSLELLPFLTNANPSTEPTGTLVEVFQLALAGSAAISASLGQGVCEKINALIAEHNKYTNNFAQEVSHARKALEEDEVAKVLTDYLARRKAITDAETGLAAAQRASQDIQRQIATLEQAIRNRRKSADELNKEMAAYLGYNELEFEIRETGYTITRNGQPAMHLSEGERTAIAFMYFLKSLSDADFDLKRGIIVIDDPVSSLDANSLYSAFGFMKARIPKPKEFDGQLFILTHNFTFFRQVKNWFNHIENPSGRRPDLAKSKLVRFYMLKSPTINGQRNAQICLLDKLLHEYESEYHYLFCMVHQAANNQAKAPLSDYYGLPNIGRRLLETVLAFKRPEKSGELYQQLLTVEDFDEAKKARIIRFTHTYSHNSQIDEPEHDLSILEETSHILRDILALVEHIDPEHFRSMSGLIASSAASQAEGPP